MKSVIIKISLIFNNLWKSVIICGQKEVRGEKMSVADLTFSYKKRKISGNDICFLFRLAYNSGFLCKFAAVKKNY